MLARLTSLGPFAIVFVAGALAGCAMFVPFLWPVVCFALVPLFAYAGATASSAKRSILLGYFWGVGLLAASLSYFFAMLPLDWLGIEASFQGFLVVLYIWLSSSLIGAIPVGAVGWLVWITRRSDQNVLLALLPILWVAGESIRAFIGTLYHAGPGTLLGPHLTFGYLGYAFAWADGLLFLAPLGGPYLFSAFAVVVNTAVFLALRQRAFQASALLTIGGGTIAGLFLLNSVLPSFVKIEIGTSLATVQDTQIILVHTDDAATFTRPTEHVEAGRDRLSTDIVALLAEHPEAAVVVLPEDRRFVGRIAAAKSGEEQKAFQALADRGAFLFDTSRVEDGEKARGVLYAYDFAAERMARVSTKSLLVPYGEYVPYSARLLARVLGFRSTVERIVSVRSSYVPTDFDARTRIVEWHGVSFGMLSCSEAFYPLHFKQIADAGADAIIVMSSQSWAPPDSKIVFNQTLGMAIVNTAWTGVPYLQATNRAPNIFVRRAAP